MKLDCKEPPKAETGYSFLEQMRMRNKRLYNQQRVTGIEQGSVIPLCPCHMAETTEKLNDS